jgi:uncharacterized protein YraI
MIKKVTVAVLVVFTLFIVGGIIITSGSEKVYYEVNTDLNLRSGAGMEYSVLFVLQKGDVVEVLSKKDDWYQVRYSGKKGYAHSDYLKYSGTVSDTNAQSSQQTLIPVFKGLIAGIILIVSLLIFSKVRDVRLLKTVTKRKRGTRSERNLVLKLLKFGIPEQMIFHDLYLKKNNDEFSQIDLVVVADVGIIVFEVKEYSGWIYGSGNQSQWTQVLAYGKQKYRFYNPIMQNNRHIRELRRKLKLFNDLPFYSIVVFYGDCVLKDINFVPKKTFLVKSNRVKDVIKIILKENDHVEYADKIAVVGILKEAVENGDYKENQIRHIENIKDMIGKDRIFE